MALRCRRRGRTGVPPGLGPFPDRPAALPDADSFDGSFTFCRGMYTSDRREAGGMGWWTDYPDADINFSIRLSELTKIHISKQPDGEPNHLVVRLTDDALFNCPMIQMEDVGTMRLSDVEVVRLREYLLKGGFLYVDDFWGEWAWEQWAEEIGRVLPPNEYPIKDITPDHQLFRADVRHRQAAADPVDQFVDADGRRDLRARRGDGDPGHPRHQRQERPADGRDDARHRHLRRLGTRRGGPALLLSSSRPDGYAVGINVVIYALTH